VIVLCGGEGLRLRPLTDDCPKPLIQVNGRPIIDYIIQHVNAHGLYDVTLAAGYKQEMLRDHFAGTAVQVIDTGSQDIAGRISQLDDGSSRETLVLYGDTLSDVDLTALITSHRDNQANATVTVWPLRSSFGLFTVDDQQLVETYHEKPTLDYWINIGYLMLSRRALDDIRMESTFEDFLNRLVAHRSLHAFPHTGVHITVNTRAELEEAENALSNWKT
jgi:glucose-1-phosphate cytidylyltransferase